MWTGSEIWTGGVGVGEASQYNSVIVDVTDDEDAVVLYICVCSDG